MFLNIILFILGLVLLYAGGEVFIKGSTSIARLFGIKPLIIAATVAAFATSAPEFFVGIAAAIKNSQDLALGNILGSCITNIALILGICAVIRPIRIQRSILRKEIPLLIISSLLMFFVCIDMVISKIEAMGLLLAFCLFVFYCIKNSKKDKNKADELNRIRTTSTKSKSFIYVIIATVLLVGGSHLLVLSAVAIAVYMGISKIVIGLTVVALGTSLPELSVSAVASVKGEHETSIGNIIGSNIFNILLIAGAVCLIRPIFLTTSTLRFELPLVVAYSVLLLPLLRTGFVLSRIEGAFLLISYAAYVWLLFNR